MPASHSHPQRCEIQGSEGDGRVHVLRRGERVPGPADAHPQNGRDAENQRTG